MAHAADLGADGKLHFATDALAHYDFEDATVLAGVLQKVSPGAAAFGYSALSEAEIAPDLVASADALEGAKAYRLTASENLGVAIVDPTVFAQVASKRVRISFWGRAEGLDPYVAVTYGNAVDLPTDMYAAWARVAAIRTGRETSDGWSEFSTGPIDGAVLDRPIHDILISGRVQYGDATWTLLNEALGRAHGHGHDGDRSARVARTMKKYTFIAAFFLGACGGGGHHAATDLGTQQPDMGGTVARTLTTGALLATSTQNLFANPLSGGDGDPFIGEFGALYSAGRNARPRSGSPSATRRRTRSRSQRARRPSKPCSRTRPGSRRRSRSSRRRPVPSRTARGSGCCSPRRAASRCPMAAGSSSRCPTSRSRCSSPRPR